MKPGWQSSEFWMAAAWTLFGVAAVFIYIAALPASWVLIAAAPAVAMAVYFAGMTSHNYGENRWQIKARKVIDAGKHEGEQRKPAFGFGHYQATADEAEESEESEEEDDE